jgi:hypothetical protein
MEGGDGGEERAGTIVEERDRERQRSSASNFIES